MGIQNPRGRPSFGSIRPHQSPPNQLLDPPGVFDLSETEARPDTVLRLFVPQAGVNVARPVGELDPLNPNHFGSVARADRDRIRLEPRLPTDRPAVRQLVE